MMTNQDFLQCERLARLYSTNPPRMGTQPDNYSHFWFNLNVDRVVMPRWDFYKFIIGILKKVK